MSAPAPREEILASLPADVTADAGAALNWLTADDDDALAWDLVSQLDLQTFLWYSLPMKWMTDSREHHEIAWAVGDFFRAAGKQRFAELCRAESTHLLIDLWDTDSPHARTEYNRLLDLSGVYPPDSDSLTWGSLMGLTEALAFTVVSDALEDAIDDGALTPGGRGWRGRAVAIAEATLARPYGEAPELCLAGAVRQERREHWLSDIKRRGLPLSQDVADAIAARSVEDLRDDVAGSVGAPSDAAALEGVAASLEPLTWLLGEIGDGITLTQTGNLPRALVLAADERYDWFDLKPKFRVRTMWDLFQMVGLHELITEERWVTKRGRRLTLSSKGRKLLGDPFALARAALGYVFDQKAWPGDGAVATAAVLLGADGTLTRDEVHDRILPYLGSRWSVDGEPLQGRNQLIGAQRRFAALAAAFGWLAPVPPREWKLHRPLNEVGRAACAAGLRHVASGPWHRM